MMFKTMKTLTRPDVNVPFFHEQVNHDDAFKDYMNLVYKDTQKMISQDRVYSDDGLQCSIVVHWDNRDSFTQFITDSVVYDSLLFPSQVYEMENGITAVATSEEL